MTDPDRILDAIDQTLDRVAVDHCITPGCGLQLRPDGPSPDFCDDICQKTWTERCVPLRPLPPAHDEGRWRFNEPDRPPQTVTAPSTPPIKPARPMRQVVNDLRGLLGFGRLQ